MVDPYPLTRPSHSIWMRADSEATSDAGTGQLIEGDLDERALTCVLEQDTHTQVKWAHLRASGLVPKKRARNKTTTSGRTLIPIEGQVDLYNSRLRQCSVTSRGRPPNGLGTCRRARDRLQRKLDRSAMAAMNLMVPIWVPRWLRGRPSQVRSKRGKLLRLVLVVFLSFL